MLLMFKIQYHFSISLNFFLGIYPHVYVDQILQLPENGTILDFSLALCPYECDCSKIETI